MQITMPTLPTFSLEEIQEIDQFCDWAPLVSTATNLVYLFIKCVYSTEAAPAEGTQSRYWTYILDKSPYRCVIALYTRTRQYRFDLLRLLYGRNRSCRLIQCCGG